MNSPTILEVLLKIFISRKFYVPCLAIGIAIILMSLLKKLVKKILIKDSKSIEAKRKNTIVVLVNNMIKYILIFITIIVILKSWNINVSSIIAGLGIVSVIAGLAIQDALKDIIMGCNIIMDNFFVVGDIVTYNDFTGEVIEFGLKTTKIRNVEGTVLVVSNRNISEIQNISITDSAVQVRIPIAYEEKYEKVEKIIDEICEELSASKYATKKVSNLGITELSESAVEYLIKAPCLSIHYYEYRRFILGTVKRILDKNKIKIPYQQIEVHNGK